MSYASRMFYSSGEGFNQIAMFSVAGLSTTMAMMVGGFQVVFPWF